MMTPVNDSPRRRKTDQIFEGLTWGKVIKIGTALTITGGIVVGVVTFLLAILVTKPELKEVARKNDSTTSIIQSQIADIKSEQQAAQVIHRLLVPMATLECIRLQQEKSTTLAVLAHLPCDSLTRR